MDVRAGRRYSRKMLGNMQSIVFGVVRIEWIEELFDGDLCPVLRHHLQGS
jgi:hypothetical protein